MLSNRVFSWSPSGDLEGKANIGDFLGPHIVWKIAQNNGCEQWLTSFRKSFFAVGSTLHYASDGDVVWGTGVNGKVPEEAHQFRSLDVRAVRGPLTREFLERRGVGCPSVYGDPGILCSLMWPLTVPNGKRDVTYVPHFRESLARHSARELECVRVLSPLSPMFYFLKAIASSALVLSSSLHGLVIAESYGVPAILVENQCGETLFKYADYYQGTGRRDFRVAMSISEALGFNAEVPDLSTAQENVLNAFPYDLLQRRDLC